MLDEAYLLGAYGPVLTREWTPDLVEMIEDANERVPGEPFDTSLLRTELDRGRRQLWIAKDDRALVVGLGITGFRNEEDGRMVLEILLVTGRNWRTWSWMLGPIESWAREHGCSMARFHGRPGWARRLPGYTAVERSDKGMMFRKALCHG